MGALWRFTIGRKAVHLDVTITAQRHNAQIKLSAYSKSTYVRVFFFSFKERPHITKNVHPPYYTLYFFSQRKETNWSLPS